MEVDLQRKKNRILTYFWREQLVISKQEKNSVEMTWKVTGPT